jgi:hypothetical protein
MVLFKADHSCCEGQQGSLGLQRQWEVWEAAAATAHRRRTRKDSIILEDCKICAVASPRQPQDSLRCIYAFLPVAVSYTYQ